MRLETIQARSVRARQRLDAKYFLAPGNIAAERIALAKFRGTSVLTLEELPSDVDVWAPNRFKRAYAMPGEDSVPYLRPYDLLEYLPRSADELSVSRTKALSNYRVSAGTLLLTCSGRNLGPIVIADKYLSRFAVSHDMVRIVIKDEAMRYYVAAVLSSPTGQALVRRDKTGSVIDHISVGHVLTLELPVLRKPAVAKISELMRSAYAVRAKARADIAGAISAYEKSLELDFHDQLKEGWTTSAKTLVGRIDAAYYEPQVRGTAARLAGQQALTIGEVAMVTKPAGRYRTSYVDSEHGRPIVSGRQLLQCRPVNLQYIPLGALRSPERYVLREGWIALPADGRAEEKLGTPVVVTAERDGWLASGHIARIVPHSAKDLWWLYLSIASRPVQREIKALSCGSVVDALYEDDISQVRVPKPPTKLAAKIKRGWLAFDEARGLEDEAISSFEVGFSRAAS